MRKIKFRGKRLDNGEWAYGHYADYIHPDCGIPSPSIIYPCPDYGNMIIAVDHSTVGQFTGLLDRNGKEIYEGDILKGTSYLYGYDLPNGEQFDYEGFVKWQSQCDVGLCWMLTDIDQSGSWQLNQIVHRNFIDYSTGIIIGNIHDNPDLIKKLEQ